MIEGITSSRSQDDNYDDKELERKKGTYRGIGTAEAAKSTMCSSVKSEERKHVHVETATHGLVFFIVDLEKKHLWILLRQLTYLKPRKGTAK